MEPTLGQYQKLLKEVEAEELLIKRLAQYYLYKSGLALNKDNTKFMELKKNYYKQGNDGKY